MKLTAQVQLLPSKEHAALLLATMREFNAACNEISEFAWKEKIFNQFALHKKLYYRIRSSFQLSAQLTVRCLSKAADAYKLNKRAKRVFRALGAITYDSRIVRYKIQGRTVSIGVLNTRIQIPFVAGEHSLTLLKYQKGESDLVYRDGKFYLLATCDVPDHKEYRFKKILGVDFGVKNIATLSTGKNYAANTVLAVRHRHRKLRTKLDKKGTKSAKRLLKKRRRKEQNFARDVNHCISKEIVSIAKGTRSAIALEDLKGIRERVTVRKAQRSTLHSWAFYQLRAFIQYKASMTGVPVYTVNPAYTSQRCNKCGHTEKKNRKSQEHFKCVSCGHSDHADINGAKNIAFLARPLSVGQTRKAA